MKHSQRLERTLALAFVMSLSCVAVACQAPTSGLNTTASTFENLKATLQPTTTSVVTSIVGLGVLGDSNSDEYRADDNRGGQYASVTLSWVELIAARRGVNFGKWSTWDEPRRTGFEYNWSRSGATVHDALVSGQVAGLAKQVTSGKVSHVIIWIGTNDFAIWNGTYQEIYDGRLNGKALQAKIDGLAADITQAVDTILRAGHVKVLLVTIADRDLNPTVGNQFPDADGRRRVSAAIQATDVQLIAMANSRGIALIDSSLLAQALIQRVDKTGMYHIGSEQINVFAKGNEPHHGQLDDEVGHPGTILSAVIANEIVIRPLNEQFGAGIPILSDEEILQSAGLLAPQ